MCPSLGLWITQVVSLAAVGACGGKMFGLLRDGAVALVGVLAVVAEGIGREADHPTQ